MPWFEILKLAQIEERDLSRFLVLMVLGSQGIGPNEVN